MKRKVLILILAFSFYVFRASIVLAPYTLAGQAFPLATPLGITSPSNVTYDHNDLNLIVTCRFLLGPNNMDLSYSLDGTGNITIPITGTQQSRVGTKTYANGTSVKVNTTFLVPFDITGEVVIPELSEGSHVVTVYAKYIANQVVGLDESTVYLTIDANSNYVQSISEFPSWIILPLFSMITLAVIFYKKKVANKVIF
jgi:hypothetical protein